MFTSYTSYKSLIKNLKRSRKIVIHDSVLPLAEKLAKLEHVKMNDETTALHIPGPDEKPIVKLVTNRVLRYKPPQQKVIGEIVTSSGVRHSVVDCTAYPSYAIFFIVEGMHGTFGINSERVASYTPVQVQAKAVA